MTPKMVWISAAARMVGEAPGENLSANALMKPAATGHQILECDRRDDAGVLGEPRPLQWYNRPMSQDEARPLVGVGVVFVRGGSVFLAKRRGAHGADTWASAGGHLESGETLEDCARREAWEELGLRVGDVRYLCLSNIIAYGKHYVDVEFAGDIGDQEPTLVEPDRFAESGWFDLDHLPQPLFQAVWYALDSLKTGRNYYSGE